MSKATAKKASAKKSRSRKRSTSRKIAARERRSVSAPTPKKFIYAKYDAAQTTPENRRHWNAVDSLSANAANSAGIRKILRSRSRYEEANNSYAKGIVLTLANDCIGTGPRWQLRGDNEARNDIVEAEFMKWSLAVKLAQKLRTMRKAKARDGEAFMITYIDKSLPSPIPLNVRVIECDRVAQPYLAPDDDEAGITYDKNGKPVSYHILDNHPGDTSWNPITSYTTMPASQVFHWYRIDRAEQRRGVPELTPSLDLFAELRRYTKAVRMAAETAAALNLYMKTAFTPESADDLGDAFTEMEAVRNAMMILPEGWDVAQMKTEQPSSTHSEFVRTILTEIARCLNMPYAVAAGDASKHNFASGRLDHQMYHKSLDVERDELEQDCLNPLIQKWLEFASVVPDLGISLFEDFSWEWFWQRREHVDPAKEALAQKMRLENGTSTLALEYAREGKDWRAAMKQKVKEQKTLIELYKVEGISPEDIAKYQPAAVKGIADATFAQLLLEDN